MVFLFFVSCGEQGTVPKPNNLIPEETMVDILYEITLINASKGHGGQLLEKMDILPSNYLYEKYSIDSTQFAASNVYYASVPKHYEQFYKTVEERLVEKRREIQILVDLQKKEQDSIKAANKKKTDTSKNEESQKRLLKRTSS